MRPDHDRECARGLARMEGYLLWSAELEQARHQARRFTDGLPWLTTAQREDVERVYAADRAAVSRAMLVRVADRSAELRGEYTERYRLLRARCVAAALLCAATAAGVCALVCGLAR